MKRIKLTQGQFAIVDDKLYDWLNQYKWYAWWNKDTQSYYAVRNSKREKGKQHKISMSRAILGLKRGDKRQADHRDYNTLDNRESNLRIVTHQQNQWNHKNPKGYYWSKRCRKYQAQIRVNGKRVFLGYFDTTIEAHNVYLEAKKLYHKI